MALILDRPLLSAARIESDTPLEVSTDGDVIVVSPVRGGRRAARFRRAVAEINRAYAGVFRRLAE